MMITLYRGAADKEEVTDILPPLKTTFADLLWRFSAKPDTDPADFSARQLDGYGSRRMNPR